MSEPILERLSRFTPDPGGTDADLADVEASYLRAGGSFDVLTDPAGAVVGTVGLFPLGDGSRHGGRGCLSEFMILRPPGPDKIEDQ